MYQKTNTAFPISSLNIPHEISVMLYSCTCLSIRWFFRMSWLHGFIKQGKAPCQVSSSHSTNSFATFANAKHKRHLSQTIEWTPIAPKRNSYLLPELNLRVQKQITDHMSKRRESIKMNITLFHTIQLKVHILHPSISTTFIMLLEFAKNFNNKGNDHSMRYWKSRNQEEHESHCLTRTIIAQFQRDQTNPIRR